MRITPLDIRKQEFRKVMRGLDAEEVHAFLTTVADEYETVLNDNKALKERLLELDDKVQEYRNMEKTLRNTLLTAERVNVEAKENARREAGLIVKEAEIEAEKTLRNIRNEQAALRNAVRELKRQKESYISRIRMVAEAHLKFIESAERDMEDVDAAVDSLPAPPDPMEPPRSEPPAMTEAKLPPVNGEADLPPMHDEADFPPVQAAAELPPIHDEAAWPPVQAAAELPPVQVEGKIPDSPVVEEASLFADLPAAEAGMQAEAAPAAARSDAEELPDLNEILERLGAKRQEGPVSHAPAAPTEPVLPKKQPQMPAAPVPPPASTTRAPAAPANSDEGEWSLERLKRDILSGTTDQHEKT